ncbi:phosphohydrolase [Deinococcus irradiatisoli]|uniref:Phosphohydrolase n=1 Tax=Deinococcus irradiatisoli TaxID=2202254 RepID=A0A2Z3JFS3_9DEIO|nr:HD domain-containing phosphohydrolase [Deinococcus irradiatisoli]AWN23825.1 phosphohydrolase [Deinococcus irradiatisoli]
MFRRPRPQPSPAAQDAAPAGQVELAPQTLGGAPAEYVEPDTAKLLGELLNRPTPEGLLDNALSQLSQRVGGDVKGYAVLRRGQDRVGAVLLYPRRLVGLNLAGPWTANRPRLNTSGTRELYAMNDESLHPQLDEAGMNQVSASLVLPLSDKGRSLGALVLDRSNGQAFTPEQQERAQKFAGVVAALLGLLDAREEARSVARTVTYAVAELAESLDFDSVGHAQAVAEVALRLGRGLGLAERELDEVWYAATLHDVGKLHGEEGHAQVSANVLHGVGSLSQAQLAVRHHHERWDGQGTPDKLSGEDIPLYARILTVADAYVRSGDLAAVRAQAGTALDPRLVGLLERSVHAAS